MRLRRLARRAGSLAERLAHAYDLWSRLGFPWTRAWRIAGTWQ